MKNLYLNLFLILSVIFHGCSTTEDMATEDLVKVSFVMNAESLNFPVKSKSIFLGYNKSAFRIMAFRYDGEDFIYYSDVSKQAIDFIEDKFIGTAQLPVGIYKFIPAYGLPLNTNNDLLLPALGKLKDSETIVHQPNGILPAIFLNENDNLPSYSLGINSENETVKATIKRAVARVDVMFIRAKKTGELYQEIPSENSVFGQYGLTSLKMEFDNLSSSVSLLNGKVLDNTVTIKSTFNLNYGDAFTIGSHLQKTTLGETADGNIYDFENIQPKDIIKNSVHAYGPFVFPNKAESDIKPSLMLTLTSGPDEGNHIYTRNISIPALNLDRNKVTLVKIYVLGEDVFHTQTEFEVSVLEAWEGVIVQEGEAQ